MVERVRRIVSLVYTRHRWTLDVPINQLAIDPEEILLRLHADRREPCVEAIPTSDLNRVLKPTTLGDVATYFFFGTGGLFLGGETGLLTGSASASRTISRDPESKARIEAAFRKFRADVLRKEADDLDGGKGIAGVLGF